jgi:hypothetical protein
MELASGPYRIEFQGLPPSPNDNLSTWRKVKSNRKWRELACETAKAAGIPRLNRPRICFTITRRNLGVADEDNDRGRFKHVIDGLRDAGVLSGDTRRHILYGWCREERGKQGFVVTLSEALPCSRCHLDTDDVASFLRWNFCLDCYAALVDSFLTQTKYNTVEEWLLKGSAHGKEEALP